MFRALVVLAVTAALFAGGSAWADSPGPASRPPSTASICAAPTLKFRSVSYALVTLSVHRDRLGLRLRRPVRIAVGVVTDHSSCDDTPRPCVVGQPCEPPEVSPPARYRVRVARMRGIKQSVALAARENGRLIYVASARCMRLVEAERRLAACLRAES